MKKLFININQKGFFHLLTANYFIGFLGLVSQLIVIKFLSPVEMGQIKILQSLIAIISIVAGFGFNTAVLKLCSEKVDMIRKKELLSRNIIYTIISMALVLLASVFLVKLNMFSPDRKTSDWLLVYLLIVPSIVFTSILMSYLQALKKIKLMATVQSAIRFIGFICIIYFTYLYGFVGFVWSNIVVGYIGLIGIFIFVKQEINLKVSMKFEKTNFAYASWSVAGNAISRTGMYMDIFILNSFSNDRETLGYYSIATIFLLGLNYITSTVQSVATPYFSEKSNNEEEFMRVFRKYLKLMIIVTVSVALVAFFVVPVFIDFIYGYDYRAVGDFFQVLVFKYVFWSSTALVGVAILSIGKMKYNFIITLFTTGIAFFITYTLGKTYGTTGVAYGQAISYFIAMLFIFFIGNRVIKYHFKKMEINKND